MRLAHRARILAALVTHQRSPSGISIGALIIAHQTLAGIIARHFALSAYHRRASSSRVTHRPSSTADARCRAASLARLAAASCSLGAHRVFRVSPSTSHRVTYSRARVAHNHLIALSLVTSRSGIDIAQHHRSTRCGLAPLRHLY